MKLAPPLLYVLDNAVIRPPEYAVPCTYLLLLGGQQCSYAQCPSTSVPRPPPPTRPPRTPTSFSLAASSTSRLDRFRMSIACSMSGALCICSACWSVCVVEVSRPRRSSRSRSAHSALWRRTQHTQRSHTLNAVRATSTFDTIHIFALILHFTRQGSMWYIVHGARHSPSSILNTVYGLRSTVHGPRSTVHDTRYTVQAQRHGPSSILNTVHGPRSTIHDPRYTVHDTRYKLNVTVHHPSSTRSTVHGPRFTVHGPRYTIHGTSSTSRSMIHPQHGPRSTVHGPRSTIHGTQYKLNVTVHHPSSIWSTVHGPRYTVQAQRHGPSSILNTVHGIWCAVHDTWRMCDVALFTIPKLI